MKRILKLLLIPLAFVLLAGCMSIPSLLGYTPLQTAVYNNDPAKVQRLLDRGADVNEKDKKGNNITALRIAAGGGRTEIVKMLLDAGADASKDGLWSAAFGGHTATVKLLLERGAQNKESTLLSAAYMGHVDVVRLLLNNGTDVNVKNSQGKTALDLAREQGHTATANLLQSVINQQMTALVNSATLPQLLAQNDFSNEALVGMLTDKLIEAKNRELPGLIATSSLDRRIALVTTVEKRLADAQTVIVELTGKAEDAVRKGQDSSGYRRHIGKLQAYMAVLAEMKNMLIES